MTSLRSFQTIDLPVSLLDLICSYLPLSQLDEFSKTNITKAVSANYLIRSIHASASSLSAREWKRLTEEFYNTIPQVFPEMKLSMLPTVFSAEKYAEIVKATDPKFHIHHKIHYYHYNTYYLTYKGVLNKFPFFKELLTMIFCRREPPVPDFYSLYSTTAKSVTMEENSVALELLQHIHSLLLTMQPDIKFLNGLFHVFEDRQTITLFSGLAYLTHKKMKNFLKDQIELLSSPKYANQIEKFISYYWPFNLFGQAILCFLTTSEAKLDDHSEGIISILRLAGPANNMTKMYFDFQEQLKYVRNHLDAKQISTPRNILNQFQKNLLLNNNIYRDILFHMPLERAASLARELVEPLRDEIFYQSDVIYNKLMKTEEVTDTQLQIQAITDFSVLIVFFEKCMARSYLNEYMTPSLFSSETRSYTGSRITLIECFQNQALSLFVSQRKLNDYIELKKNGFMLLKSPMFGPLDVKETTQHERKGVSSKMRLSLENMLLEILTDAHTVHEDKYSSLFNPKLNAFLTTLLYLPKKDDAKKSIQKLIINEIRKMASASSSTISLSSTVSI